MSPEFQMGFSPAGSPFWRADVQNRADCNVVLMVVACLRHVVKMQRLTLVRSSWQTNSVETVNSISWLDTLNKPKGRRTFFPLLMRVSFICLYPLPLAETQNDFPGWLSWFHRPAGPASDRKLNAHNKRIRSSGGVR